MLNDRAYTAARQLIISGTLVPGTRISEPELSGRLDLGTAAVRTALTRLAQEGLVQPIPRKGYVISPLTIRGAQEIIDIRIALEPRAAFLAAGRIDPAEAASLRPHFVQGYQIGDREGLDRLLAANSAYRKMVARASGNERLATMISGLVDEMDRYLRLSWEAENRSESLLTGFDATIEALLAGRGQQAQRLAVVGLNRTAQHVLAALSRRQEILGLSLTPI
jgi:DNA-binding GntR family transcriptional regulator